MPSEKIRGRFHFRHSRKEIQAFGLAPRVVPCQRDFRFGRGGNSEVISDRQQRYGFAFRPVRAALPWRMPMPARVVSSATTALAQW